MRIDIRSAVIGMLLGVCICLVAFLVLGQGVERAQAHPAVAPGRYQLAITTKPDYRVFIYVIDQHTRSVYTAPAGKDASTRSWTKVVAGPPR